MLADGRRIVLDDQRGYSSRARTVGGLDPSDMWPTMTREGVEGDVRAVVLADDDEDREEHLWDWLVD